MKILMVSIPSIHFYRWTRQLEDAGHEIHWFDSNGSGTVSKQIKWVHQITNWKIKWDFPGRSSIKKKLPKLYQFLQTINEYDIEKAFEKVLSEIQPDVVHSFAMQISCLPIKSVMMKYPHLKWVYSSWGSDIYYAENIGVKRQQFEEVLSRIDYYISDCKRDQIIVKEVNAKIGLLGVFPGNGGVYLIKEYVKPFEERKKILIKGYNDGIGVGLNIVKAIAIIPVDWLKKYELVIYGADEHIVDFIDVNSFFKEVKTDIFLKNNPLPNEELLKLMGDSLIHIGCSLSDGMPNAMLEAMGMGAFPIQSNPGGATSEVINDKENGLLINDPLVVDEIKKKIEYSLLNLEIAKKAYFYNMELIEKNYSKEALKEEIKSIYDNIN